MTGEEHVEEMMWDAHQKGMSDELLSLAKSIRYNESNMSFGDSIYKAYYELEIPTLEFS